MRWLRRHGRSKPLLWSPDVGDEVWFQFAGSIEVGRIEAIRGGIYAIRHLSDGVMRGQMTTRTKSDLWPPELMLKVGTYPPGWRTEPRSKGQ